MYFLRPIQWYHSYADPIWEDGTFKFIHHTIFKVISVLRVILMVSWQRDTLCKQVYKNCFCVQCYTECTIV